MVSWRTPQFPCRHEDQPSPTAAIMQGEVHMLFDAKVLQRLISPRLSGFLTRLSHLRWHRVDNHSTATGSGVPLHKHCHTCCERLHMTAALSLFLYLPSPSLHVCALRQATQQRCKQGGWRWRRNGVDRPVPKPRPTIPRPRSTADPDSRVRCRPQTAASTRIATHAYARPCCACRHYRTGGRLR